MIHECLVVLDYLSLEGMVANTHAPKSPKVEIHVFKGEGDVLKWLYQMEHLFSLHDTPLEDRVEFFVFYL